MFTILSILWKVVFHNHKVVAVQSDTPLQLLAVGTPGEIERFERIVEDHRLRHIDQILKGQESKKY